MFRFDHRQIKADPRVSAFRIKCMNNERRIISCTFIGRLQIVAKAAARKWFDRRSLCISINEGFDLINSRRRDRVAGRISDDLSYLH